MTKGTMTTGTTITITQRGRTTEIFKPMTVEQVREFIFNTYNRSDLAATNSEQTRFELNLTPTESVVIEIAESEAVWIG